MVVSCLLVIVYSYFKIRQRCSNKSTFFLSVLMIYKLLKNESNKKKVREEKKMKKQEKRDKKKT